jgi:hypothetical protein
VRPSAASGDEGVARAAAAAQLRRSASVRAGYGSDTSFPHAPLFPQGSPRGEALMPPPLRRSGTLPAMLPPRGGSAEKLGLLRRSMLPSLLPEHLASASAGERSRTALPPTARSLSAEMDAASLLRDAPQRTESDLARAFALLSPAGASPPGSRGSGALRLVTASGQPRKLPAGAAASGTYAGAFFAPQSGGGTPPGS